MFLLPWAIVVFIDPYFLVSVELVSKSAGPAVLLPILSNMPISGVFLYSGWYSMNLPLKTVFLCSFPKFGRAKKLLFLVSG